MKKYTLTATVFIIVLLGIAAAVWVKLEMRGGEQEVASDSAVAKDSKSVSGPNYEELPGSHLNPIESFSGETYTEVDEETGISMELPVEFRDRFEREGLKGNQVSFYGLDKHDLGYKPVFWMSFQIAYKNDFDKRPYSYNLLKEHYPLIKDLKNGETFTYKVMTQTEKEDFYGSEYLMGRPNIGDTIYTKVENINNWNVYEYIDDNESEITNGYIAIIETKEYYMTIYYSTYYIGVDDTGRTEYINTFRDMFFTMLNSAKLGNKFVN